MPKQTFFNLSKEKRETIITAALKEFARVPFSEASIANIVKDADISRGSFYQYFDDKDDLFFYLLDKHAKDRKTGFIVSLKKHQGNIFKAMSEMFQLILIELDDRDLRDFYQNVFLYWNYKNKKKLVNNISNNAFNKQFEEIKALINTDALNVANDKDLFHVVQIISSVMMQNFVLKFAKELTNDEVMENFDDQLRLLKAGFKKKDNS